MKVSYKQIPKLLRNIESFQDNSVAVILDDEGYRVCSYSTLVYKEDKDDNAMFNKMKLFTFLTIICGRVKLLIIKSCI
jgi:hypothetical protein